MSLQTGLLELGWNTCSNVQSDSKMKNLIFIRRKDNPEFIVEWMIISMYDSNSLISLALMLNLS